MEDNTRHLPVQVMLAHPENGDGGRRTEIRLMDVRSRVIIATVVLTAEQFRDMIAGHVNSDYPIAAVATLPELVKVGLRKSRFTRSLGRLRAESIPAAETWIGDVQAILSLHAGTLESHNYGHVAAWTVWSNMDGYVASVSERIADLPIPETLQ